MKTKLCQIYSNLTLENQSQTEKDMTRKIVKIYKYKVAVFIFLIFFIFLNNRFYL